MASHTPCTHTSTNTPQTSDLPIAEAMIANSYVRHSNLCWDYTIQQLERLMRTLSQVNHQALHCSITLSAVESTDEICSGKYRQQICKSQTVVESADQICSGKCRPDLQITNYSGKCRRDLQWKVQTTDLQITNCSGKCRPDLQWKVQTRSANHKLYYTVESAESKSRTQTLKDKWSLMKNSILCCIHVQCPVTSVLMGSSNIPYDND